MSRPIVVLQLNGHKLRALFDTGSFRTYIREDLAKRLPRFRMPRPVRVGLGGHPRTLKEFCLGVVKLEGLPFELKAFPLKRIGTDDQGKEIDMIVGALTMEEYGLIPNPQTGKVALQKLKKREFTEY